MPVPKTREPLKSRVLNRVPVSVKRVMRGLRSPSLNEARRLVRQIETKVRDNNLSTNSSFLNALRTQFGYGPRFYEERRKNLLTRVAAKQALDAFNITDLKTREKVHRALSDSQLVGMHTHSSASDLLVQRLSLILGKKTLPFLLLLIQKGRVMKKGFTTKP
ncbi:MAG: hypothetical protein HY917_02140 [Candidatus Diapherotrites archaeon]|nr:hypothetical protein [Candidatus Diapherotrites archaeon]